MSHPCETNQKHSETTNHIPGCQMCETNRRQSRRSQQLCPVPPDKVDRNQWTPIPERWQLGDRVEEHIYIKFYTNKLITLRRCETPKQQWVTNSQMQTHKKITGPTASKARITSHHWSRRWLWDKLRPKRWTIKRPVVGRNQEVKEELSNEPPNFPCKYWHGNMSKSSSRLQGSHRAAIQLSTW